MGGDLLYRWGNPMNYDRGNQQDRMLIGQHDANWIDNGFPGEGNILIYNNGSITSFGQDFTQSSVVQIEPPINEYGIYEIDEVYSYSPLNYNWSYTDDFFSHIMSGVRRLENGNTLIVPATENKIFEINSEREIVWEYLHNEPGHNSISKAFKYPLDYLRSGSLLLGDVNFNQNIDIFDILLIINYILEINQMPESQIYLSDINGDLIVTIEDIISLVSIIMN